MPVWIRCEDKLPPKGKIVLVSDGEQVGLGFMGLHGVRRVKKYPIFFRPIMLDPLNNIVAWQPLPRPFRGK